MDYAGILIERENGKLLFQLRDNNPSIKHRNCWGLFGGWIKKNEKSIRAAIRELKEELGLTVKKDQLFLWAVFLEFKKKNYLFKLKLGKNIKNLKLLEGSSMGFFTIGEIIRKNNVVFSLRLLLLSYFIISLVKK